MQTVLPAKNDKKILPEPVAISCGRLYPRLTLRFGQAVL